MEMASQMSDMSRNIETLMIRFEKQPIVANQVLLHENHGMDMYPRDELVSPRKEEIQAVHPSRQSRQLDDPFSNTYNPGWARHPNLSYRNNHCLNPQLPHQQNNNNNWYPPQGYPPQEYLPRQKQSTQPWKVNETLPWCQQGQRNIEYLPPYQYHRNDPNHMRITSMEGVVKTLERQIGQYAEVSQRKEPGRLPS